MCAPWNVSQEKYVRSAEIDAVAERIEADLRTSAGMRDVCEAFRSLIVACSASTFMVRAASFTPAELQALEKSQAASVRLLGASSSLILTYFAPALLSMTTRS